MKIGSTPSPYGPCDRKQTKIIERGGCAGEQEHVEGKFMFVWAHFICALSVCNNAETIVK